MNSSSRRLFTQAALLAAAGAQGLAVSALAQPAPWPSQPIRIVVPFAAGGANDVLARVLTEKLGAALNTPVIAENRPGAGATLGASQVAVAKPDGYTVMMMASPHLVAPVLYKDLPYDPLNSFVPIARLAESPFVLALNPQVPAKNVKEFVALAKSQPGKMNFGSSGNGGNQHLYGQMFLTATGTDLKHIPYKGSAPAMVDLVAGQIQMSFMALPNALPQMKNGRLKVLAVMATKRLPDIPDVPTFTEAGVPGFESSAWIALAAPKGTPAPIVARMDSELKKILANPDVIKQLAAAGLESDYLGAEEMGPFLREESARWLKVARSVNLAQ